MLSWARVGALVLAVGLSLISCDSLSNRLGIVTGGQIESAKSRIAEVYARVPKIQGAILIQQAGAMDDSRDTICTTYYLKLLYGTNDLSYPDVLSFYHSVAQSSGWQPHPVTDDIQGYSIDNNIGITISNHYGYDPFSGTIFSEGENKFKTVFLITLGTPVVLPYSEYCLHRQG